MSMDNPVVATACSACGSPAIRAIVSIAHVPIHCNVLWPTREEALAAPRGNIDLAFCGTCGHVFNRSFDPSLMEYTQAYENSLHFSARFQEYATALARRLVDLYAIRGKDVIDIGCGKGDFLAMVCEYGDNRGFGFDPSYVPEHMAPERAARMSIVQDFYSAQYASTRADLITCRHVLEHIQHPRGFVENVRQAVGSRMDTVVFFEMPNVLYTLKDLGIWDLIYEHCSYFSPPSLREVFRSSGFAVKELHDLYEGQFLGIDTVAAPAALPGQDPATPGDVQMIDGYVQKFADEYSAKVAHWKGRLEEWTRLGKRVAAWGGGSKGVTFLNVLQPGTTVGCMVDINPRKQGMFVSGTGQPVVGPEALRNYAPDVVIIMNPVYKAEITGQLAALGLTPAIELA
jgi:SAM-dependent methyltransferase